ncbi:MAG: BatD family protein, partial [Bacteroidota bacterium]|nr:BatD family protein [Bacteroidota bacterium]
SYFEQPQISGAEIISGPYTSKSSSNINGRESYSGTYTLILKPTQTGTITLSPAKIRAGNKTCISQGVSIEVRNRGNFSTQNYARSQNSTSYPQQLSTPKTEENTKIDNNSIFIRATTDKNSIVKGEAIFVSVKLYILESSGVQTEDYSMDKMPNFYGFEIAEIDLKDKSHYTTEIYNGKKYKVATLGEIIAFPYATGELSIPKIEVDVLLRIPARTNFSNTGDAFIDSFFQNSILSYKNAKIHLQTNEIKINVDNLPQPMPHNFMEGVGKFALSSVVSADEVRAYDGFYLIYTIEGEGNLSQITSLPIKLPESFQTSTPEIIDNIETSHKGLSGSRTFRYLVIPSDTGNFVIPKLTIYYYDKTNKEYKLLESEEFGIYVSKSNVSGEYAKQLEQRAKYRNMSIVPTKDFATKKEAKHIFDRISIYIILLVLIIFAVVGIGLYSNRIKNLSNPSDNKSKQASIVAIKRLKKAKSLLDNKEYDDFEGEITSVLWTYLLDKFKIEKSKFTIEDLSKQLIKEGISTSIAEKLTDIFNRCLYMRYSQDNGDNNYNDIYQDTLQIITSMEEETKQNNTPEPQMDNNIISMGKKGLSIFVFILLTSCSLNLFANTEKKNIPLNERELCLRAEEYFKNKDYANSILYYEKALKLSPNNENIKLNINIVRSRLIGDCYIMPDFLLVRVFRYFAGCVSLIGWAVLTIILCVLVCLSFCFYRFSNKKILWFYVCLVCFVLFAFSLSLGITRQHIQNNTNNAIIMENDIKLKTFKQENSKDVLSLYKGQKITIIEEEKTWLKIQTEDKREGYINNHGYKRI